MMTMMMMMMMMIALFSAILRSRADSQCWREGGGVERKAGGER